MAEAKKLPSGSWRVNQYVGRKADGKRHYKSFTGETKREAEYLAAEYMMHHKGEETTSMTLGEAIDAYIESKSNVLSPSTLRGYNAIRRNRLASLMKKDLKELTNKELQRAINEEAKTLSPKTLRNITGLLVPVFGAYRPAFNLNVTLPQKEKKEFYIPSEDAMKRLYKLAEGKRVELPMLLASQLGMRASEIAGLTFDCIDRERGAVTVKQARVYGVNGNEIKTPKSYAGNRTIPCPGHILEKLPEGEGEKLVLNVTSNDVTRLWISFMRSTDEEYFNFHALRHYFCSTALLLGIPKRYVAEIMGHASENMINRVYEHTFKDKKNEFAETLKSFFESTEGQKNQACNTKCNTQK